MNNLIAAVSKTRFSMPTIRLFGGRAKSQRSRMRRPAFLRFSNRDQVHFAKRLAMILRAGIPIMEGLHILSAQRHSSSSTYIYGHLLEQIENGQTLSGSMSKFERIFGAFCINIVRVGETSGTLHQNLDYLAEELKKKETLKKKVIGALVYPAVVVTATIGIALVLTVYIFPKISPIFQSFKTTLPLSTRMLISISNFLIQDGGILFVGIIAVSIAYFFLLRVTVFHSFMDRVLLRLPLFGKLSKNYNIVNATRTLALLLRAEVRIIEALEIVGTSSRNLMYHAAIRSIEKQVMKGQKLSHELAKFPRLFPPLMTHMVHVGEETGNLSESLMYVSSMYEEEINDLTKNLTTLLEPALMIVMGIIVGFIAISIITPIYGITQNLHT